MKIYIDSDFKCHVAQAEGLTEVETEFFDGLCQEYIEGYRYVPEGSTWTRGDGVEFHGEMIAPWKPWRNLDDAQRRYEKEQYVEVTNQNEELINTIADMVEEVYQSDLEVMQ